MLLKKLTRMSVLGVAAAALLGQLTGVKLITPAFAGIGGVPYECFVYNPETQQYEPTTNPCLAKCCEAAERCLARAGGDFQKEVHCYDRFNNCQARCPGFSSPP